MGDEEQSATRFGREVRAARLALGMSQVEVAAEVGLDRSVVSRMELGRGIGVGLHTWFAVADVVGLRLELARGPGHHPVDRDAICRRTIEEVAALGGWVATAEPSETLLSRGSERIVVRVWDPITVVGPEIARLEASMDREGANGLVVIPATGANRRRVSESRSDLRAVFPAPGNRWYVALVSRGRTMPESPGILWAHPDCGRLRVAGNLPGWIWTKVGDGPRFATGRRQGPGSAG